MAIEFNVESQVKTYATISAFPSIGAVKTIYIALDTKLIYVYDSGAYTSIGDATSAEWGHINGDITSQVDLQSALNDKFNNPTGDSTQYLDGAGTPTTFPAFASADKMVTIGRNATGSTLYKGTIVYINGSTGNRPNFVKAQANSEMTSAGTFGVIEADIPNNADGNCVTIGTISDLDTRSSAPHPFTSDTLADGDTIYLSPTTAGFITNVKPYAPNHLVYLGKVVRTSPTNGTIVYRVQNGYELDELHDVSAQTPNNNEVLSFESATTLWKPKSLTTLLGFTPVPNSRMLTINGVTQDLSADRTFTISTGITIGTTAITSGTIGRILFEGTGNVVSESANLFWDNTNGRLGIGTSSPSAIIHSVGSVTASGATARGNYLNNTLVASANNDVLVGLDVQPTFTNGAFTGVTNFGLRSSINYAGEYNGILIRNTNNTAGVGVSRYALGNDANTLLCGFNAFSSVYGSYLNNASVLATFPTSDLILATNFNLANGGTSSIKFFTGGYTSGQQKMQITGSTGNVLIGTTTDAGYKLDVNGTARVQSNAASVATILGTTTSARLVINNATTTPNVGLSLQSNSVNKWSLASYGSTSDFTFYNDAIGADALFIKGTTNNVILGSTTDVSSALLNVTSTTKGFLPPRQTQAQRTAIASPAIGLQVYQTDGVEGLYIYKSTGWALLL